MSKVVGIQINGDIQIRCRTTSIEVAMEMYKLMRQHPNEIILEESKPQDGHASKRHYETTINDAEIQKALNYLVEKHKTNPFRTGDLIQYVVSTLHIDDDKKRARRIANRILDAGVSMGKLVRVKKGVFHFLESATIPAQAAPGA